MEARADDENDAAALDDGYCDYVRGVAAAQRALLLAPELFATFGRVDQRGLTTSPGDGRDDLRIIAGVEYSFNSAYRARLVGQRADALCRRHRARAATTSDATYRALEARIAVLTTSMKEAEKRLATTLTDFERRRATRQEVVAVRIRVEKLREIIAASRRQLAALPPPGKRTEMADALASYYAAEARLEDREGALRRAAGWDLGVRFGYDQFLEDDSSSPYFALVTARLNLGWLVQGGANERAAKGRRRFALRDGGIGGIEANQARLQALLETERERAEQNRLMVRDLEIQLDALRRMASDAGERLERTVWFELAEARAEQAYLETHIESLEAILGVARK